MDDYHDEFEGPKPFAAWAEWLIAIGFVSLPVFYAFLPTVAVAIVWAFLLGPIFYGVWSATHRR